MRTLMMFALLALLAAPALAVNPDGKPGTIWLEGRLSSSADGQWVIDANSAPDARALSRTLGGLSMGIVVDHRLTVEIGTAWDHARSSDMWQFYQNGQLYDQKDDLLMLSLRVRWYVRLP